MSAFPQTHRAEHTLRSYCLDSSQGLTKDELQFTLLTRAGLVDAWMLNVGTVTGCSTASGLLFSSMDLGFPSDLS